MRFINISQKKQSTYTLTKNEEAVFFLLNRSGTVTFRLTGEGAKAHIFAFFTQGTGTTNLTVHQRHLAPHTTSTVLIKAALKKHDAFSSEGLIHIAKNAHQADASYECRSLLLSPNARVFTKPALEIYQNDVRCRHAATASPLNEELLFLAQTRGLSLQQARTLLVHGFFQDALKTMESLRIDTATILPLLHKHL